MVFTGQLAISSSPKCSFASTLRCERDVVINILPPHHQEVRILVILCDGLVGDLDDLSCHLPDLVRETSMSCGMDTCRERGQWGSPHIGTLAHGTGSPTSGRSLTGRGAIGVIMAMTQRAGPGASRAVPRPGHVCRCDYSEDLETRALLGLQVDPSQSHGS